MREEEKKYIPIEPSSGEKREWIQVEWIHLLQCNIPQAQVPNNWINNKLNLYLHLFPPE